MKLSVAYFALASMWHSVIEQEDSTFLCGSGAEGAVTEEDKRASFGNIFNSHKQQPVKHDQHRRGQTKMIYCKYKTTCLQMRPATIAKSKTITNAYIADSEARTRSHSGADED
jgi:hypothetical protein